MITQFLKWRLNPPDDPDQHWYYLGELKNRWFGNLRFHAYAAIVFGVVALWPAGTYVFGKELTDEKQAVWWDFFRLNPFQWAELHPGQFVLWAFFITSSLPLFVWLEAAEFENWMAEKARPQPDVQRRWFETNARHVESFWKTIGSFFIGVGLLTLAKDRADASKRDTTKELTDAMQAETQKVTSELRKIEAALAKLAAATEAQTKASGAVHEAAKGPKDGAGSKAPAGQAAPPAGR